MKFSAFSPMIHCRKTTKISSSQIFSNSSIKLRDCWSSFKMKFRRFLLHFSRIFIEDRQDENGRWSFSTFVKEKRTRFQWEEQSTRYYSNYFCELLHQSLTRNSPFSLRWTFKCFISKREEPTNKLLSPIKFSIVRWQTKEKLRRRSNSFHWNNLKLLWTLFENDWRFVNIHDSLFSPTKKKKTKIHFQRVLISLLSRFPLTLNITVKTFSLERLCCIIRPSSCQNTSSNWFAKNSWEHFSVLSLNFVIGENVKWETNTFLLLIAKICSGLYLCCCLSVVVCQMKRCKDLQWDRSLFVSLLNESFFVKWKLTLHSVRWARRNFKTIVHFSSIEGEFPFHQQIHIVSIEQLFQFKLRFCLFQTLFSSFVKVHLNNWKTNKGILLSFFDCLFSQLISTLKFTTLLLCHRSLLLTKTRMIILLIVAKIRSIEMQWSLSLQFNGHKSFSFC